MCQEILEELNQSYLMLQKCEHLFTNSIIIAKCYRLIKVNQAIFLKIKPHVNVIKT